MSFPLHNSVSAEEVEAQITEQMNGQLMDAVMFGRVAEAARFIDMGASIECQDSNGATPLIWAASVGDLQTIYLLLKKGANVNVRDKSGWTPLHHAAYNNHRKTCEKLLQKGADPYIKDKTKKRPYKVAKNKQLASYLKKEAKKLQKDGKIAVDKSEIGATKKGFTFTGHTRSRLFGGVKKKR